MKNGNSTGKMTDLAFEAVKPNFFIAGARKCGSSSLVAALSEHPQITFGRTKEPGTMFLPSFVHRFLHDIDRLDHFTLNEKEDLYRNLVNAYPDVEPGLIRGEGTPHYIYYSQMADRISRYCPEAKLIFMLRHPTKRLWSSYGELVRGGHGVTSFEQSLTRGTMRVLAERFYVHGLSPYYRCFDESQIMIVPFEEWLADRQSVNQRILRHLEVDDEFELPEKHVRPRWRPQNQPLALAANYAKNATRSEVKGSNARRGLRVKAQTTMGTLAEIGLRKIATSSLVPSFLHSEATLQPETEKRLNEYFTVGEQGLSALTGVDFKKWWDLDV